MNLAYFPNAQFSSLVAALIKFENLEKTHYLWILERHTSCVEIYATPRHCHGAKNSKKHNKEQLWLFACVVPFRLMPRISYHWSKGCSCTSWQTGEGGTNTEGRNWHQASPLPTLTHFLQHYSGPCAQSGQRVGKTVLQFSQTASVITQLCHWLVFRGGVSEMQHISSPTMLPTTPKHTGFKQQSFILIYTQVSRMRFRGSRLGLAGWLRYSLCFCGLTEAALACV